ncbi:hypothetical protein A20C1_03926 [marine actinobacterium PHSC20C1]|nr:hypothetical protein A20C1_03926 [marine actinobacterium PHSC20C1]
MGLRLLLIAAWFLPVAILVLGVNAGATIWFYLEPQMDASPAPDSYGVAFWSGVVALLLSVLVAVGISIQVASTRLPVKESP